MKINETLLKEKLSTKVGLNNISMDGAVEYADKLCKVLFEETSPVLSSHHIGISNHFTHDNGVSGKDGMSLVFQISYESDDVCKPTMSTRKAYDDANMLILFDVGWDIAKSHQIKEWDKATHKPLHSRLHYDGDQFIKEACEKFNASAPSGVFAEPIIF